MAAERLALESLDAYDAAPLPPAPARARFPVERDEGRLLRLGLLPLAAWCGSVLLDLSAIGIVGAVLAAVLVAGAIARFR